MSQLPQPVELVAPRIRGGVLAAALPAPEGWQRGGLAVPWYSCGEPILRNKCIQGEDEAHRPVVATYPTFPIEQGSTCSTLSGLDHEAFALGRLDATTEWALGRQLALDIAGTGAPSLNDAEVGGPYTEVVDAIACLEQCAADSGFGTQWFLHTSPRGAAYARHCRMMNNDGFSPTGARWIVSPGYPDQGTTPDTVRFWATGPVWAGVDAPTVNAAVDWRQNEDTAYALRVGIVAFDPCILCAVDVTVGECLAPQPPSPVITFPGDGDEVAPLTPIVGRGCGPDEPVQLWVNEDAANNPGAAGRQVDSGTTNANGAFYFVGTTPIAPGTHEFWVVCGGQESPRITVTVEAETETLSFDWALLSADSGTEPNVNGKFELTATPDDDSILPAGDYVVTWDGGPTGTTTRDSDLESGKTQLTTNSPGAPAPVTVSGTVTGPYGIEFSATGTTVPWGDGETTIDSGTVTYTRPVSN
jgi:hypothetical protein